MNALLVVGPRHERIGNPAHNVYEGALAGFGSRPPRTQIAGEQGVDLVSAAADVPQQTRIRERLDKLINPLPRPLRIDLVGHRFQVVSVEVRFMQTNETHHGAQWSTQPLLDKPQRGEQTSLL